MAAALASGCAANAYEHALGGEQQDVDRPLVVMATAEWCGPCKYFKKRVLPTPEVQAALSDVRFVMLDARHNAHTLRRLGVTAYPTFLVIAPQERVVAGIKGAVSAAKFVDFLKWGTPNWFTEEHLASELAASPGRRIHLYAARYFALHGRLPEARVHYEQALAKVKEGEPARKATLAWEIALVGSVGLPMEVVARRAMAFIASYPDAAEVRAAAEVALLSGVLREVEADALADRALEAFWDQPTTLNGFVYTLLAAKQPARALRAAERQIELQPDDANAYDTLAEALNALGRTDDALRASDAAIRMETSSDSRAMYKANRKRFATRTAEPKVTNERMRFEQLVLRYRIRR